VGEPGLAAALPVPLFALTEPDAIEPLEVVEPTAGFVPDGLLAVFVPEELPEPVEP